MDNDILAIAIQTLGGLGLFLMGMVIMTDNLRNLAGASIRSGLLRFTRTPASGAVTGAVSTAILQSSSATTVATVGFVGSSLMAFPEALGIIFGANIGTTITGWLVALLGFKLQLSSFALPIVFTGVLLRLFGHGKTASAGFALAGFALIFIGIATMQQGMTGLHGILTPADLPGDSWVGRLQLVLIGLVFTVVTQSSSAGVAMALTALYTNNINFHQAAALVIGMDVGTTITAFLATIGGSIGARRTGYSHIIYNCFTAIGALLLISPFVWCWQQFISVNIVDHGEIALVAFHTTFNTLGVLAVLPFTHHFARLIEKMVPDKTPGYSQKLDISLLQQPVLALTEIQVVIKQQFITLLQHMQSLLSKNTQGQRVSMLELQASLDSVHAFIDKIHLHDENTHEWARLIELMHTLDHLQRLHERCDEETTRALLVASNALLESYRDIMLESTTSIIRDMIENNGINTLHVASDTNKKVTSDYTAFRNNIMKSIGHGELDVPDATRLLESIRWLRRVNRHIEHITRHYVASIEETSEAISEKL